MAAAVAFCTCPRAVPKTRQPRDRGGQGTLRPPERSDVFKFAVREMAEVSRPMLDRNGFSPADLTLFVPHQANMRIMEAAVKRMELPRERWS